MTHHLAACFVDIGTTADTKVPALTDDVLTISDNNFLPQFDLDLLYVAAVSATLNRVRLVSPSNRIVTTPYIRPIEIGSQFGDNPNIADYVENPFRVRGLEQFEVQASSDIAMGTEQCFVLLGFSQAMEPAPRGNIFTLRGTSTTAAVAESWTTLATTWQDTLPEGDFIIVGLNVIGTGQIGARIIIEGQTWRPGCVASVSVGQRNPRIFRKSRLGNWGRFRSTAMPKIQVLNTTTTASFTVYMDIIRVG